MIYFYIKKKFCEFLYDIRLYFVDIIYLKYKEKNYVF